MPEGLFGGAQLKLRRILLCYFEISPHPTIEDFWSTSKRSADSSWVASQNERLAKATALAGMTGATQVLPSRTRQGMQFRRRVLPIPKTTSLCYFLLGMDYSSRRAAIGDNLLCASSREPNRPSTYAQDCTRRLRTRLPASAEARPRRTVLIRAARVKEGRRQVCFCCQRQSESRSE